MQVSSVMDSTTYSATSAMQTTLPITSFASCLAEASGSTSKSDDSGLQEFMRYAKETPAQRMFDSWLGRQNISMEQYNSMSAADKQKLVDQFEAEMKQKLKSEMAGSGATTAAS